MEAVIGTDAFVPPIALHEQAAKKGVKFGPSDGFDRELRRRVGEYFAATGKKRRDCPRMYLKTAIILTWFVASYSLLVFGTWPWWTAAILAASLGLSTAGIGFNIQHDGGHHAYSDHPWVNKLMSLSLDLIGGSSYVWARKHNSIHHSYSNITGEDDDINLGALARLSPHQPRLRFHRLQHLYLWVLYGFLPIKWQLYADYQDVITGHMGGHKFPRPKGWDLVTFIAGKCVFLTLAFGIPLWLHSVSSVIIFYLGAMYFQGLALSVVFQLAHCVEEAEFPMPKEDTGRIEAAWAAHQVQTTVDFAQRNRVLSWFVGGLNFQIEHHLFPQICHTHYAALAPLVEETCRKFGLRYAANPTFRAGVASHFRWLRRMGMPETAAA